MQEIGAQCRVSKDGFKRFNFIFKKSYIKRRVLWHIFKFNSMQFKNVAPNVGS